MSEPAQILTPLLSATATLSYTLTIQSSLHSALNSTKSTTPSPLPPRSIIARTLSLTQRASLPYTLSLNLLLPLTALVSVIRAYRAVPLTLAPSRTNLQWQRRALLLTGALSLGRLFIVPKLMKLASDMAYAYERVGQWNLQGERPAKGDAADAIDAEEQGLTGDEVADGAVLSACEELVGWQWWIIGTIDLPVWATFLWLRAVQ